MDIKSMSKEELEELSCEFSENGEKAMQELLRRLQEGIDKKKQEAQNREMEWLEIEKQRLNKLQECYNFELCGDILNAIERLEGLAVNKYRMLDYAYQDSFDEVWRSVLDVITTFEEGKDSPLNKTTYKGTKNWLMKWSYLCKDGIPDEYKRRE